jgi:hypothetical protein
LPAEGGGVEQNGGELWSTLLLTQFPCLSVSPAHMQSAWQQCWKFSCFCERACCFSPPTTYPLQTYRPKVQNSKGAVPAHIKDAGHEAEMAWQLAQGGIPHDPAVLSARIKQLLELEAKVPGLDCMWIFKHK